MDESKQLSINNLYPKNISSVKLKIKIKNKKIPKKKVTGKQIDIGPEGKITSPHVIISNENLTIIENYFI